MGTKDPRIDAYIAKSAENAEPILKHIRRQVQAIEWMAEGKSRNWKYQDC